LIYFTQNKNTSLLSSLEKVSKMYGGSIFFKPLLLNHPTLSASPLTPEQLAGSLLE
jgi:hypothetical protein